MSKNVACEITNIHVHTQVFSKHSIVGNSISKRANQPVRPSLLYIIINLYYCTAVRLISTPSIDQET